MMKPKLSWQMQKWQKKKEPQTTAVAQLTIACQKELFIWRQVRLHFGLLPTSPAEEDGRTDAKITLWISTKDGDKERSSRHSQWGWCLRARSLVSSKVDEDLKQGWNQKVWNYLIQFTQKNITPTLHLSIDWLIDTLHTIHPSVYLTKLPSRIDFLRKWVE